MMPASRASTVVIAYRMTIVGRPQERTVAERLARRPQELVLPAKLVIIPASLASKMVLLPAFMLMSLALVEVIAALVLVVSAIRARVCVCHKEFPVTALCRRS
jgi:hypothetical protein